MARKVKDGDGTLGDQIRRARVAAGLTQVQLAERLGVAQPNVSAIERGDRPTIQTLIRLADVLGADFSYDGRRVTFARRK